MAKYIVQVWTCGASGKELKSQMEFWEKKDAETAYRKFVNKDTECVLYSPGGEKLKG